MPNAIAQSYELFSVGQMSIITLLVLILIMVFVVAVIIFVETGQRRLPFNMPSGLWKEGLWGSEHPSSS
jgi:preprotein translocase subunit SecY